MSPAIIPTPKLPDELTALQAELDAERHQLQQDEAALASEQASVNRFRMHARLRLDDLVERLLENRTRKQKAVTQLALLQQRLDNGLDLEFELDWEADDPFAEFEDFEPPRVEPLESELLPDPTPNDRRAERRLYRELAKRFHPDSVDKSVEQAYATSMMAAVNEAYARRDINALRSLAGELDPETVARLSGGVNRELRRLRKSLLAAKRRRKRVHSQLTALRAENAARLWRRAQVLESQDQNWWDAVRAEIEKEMARHEAEIQQIFAAIDNLHLTTKANP